jgi:hypothetical protein
MTRCEVRDCCVCGSWCRIGDMFLLNNIHIHPRLRKNLNTTLAEKYICRRCKHQCAECSAIVTRIQTETALGLCAECAGRKK